MTQLARQAAVESSPIDGVRSDVRYFGGRRDFAIEVVVTHALEPETRSRYEAASVPVFSLHPTWDSLATLCAEAEVVPEVGVRCPSCRALERRLDTLRARLRVRRGNSGARRWTRDKPGNHLPAALSELLHDAAMSS